MKTVVVAVAAMGCLLLSLILLVNAYNIWSRYNWAMWRLQYPLLFDGSSVLDPQLRLAIAEYAGVFPSHFVIGIFMLTLALATPAIKSRKTTLLIVIIAVSGAVLLGEAYKIWEMYTWSNSQNTTPPWSYYNSVRGSALSSFENLFWLSIQIGVIEVASGLVSTGMHLRWRLKRKPDEPTVLISTDERTKKR